MTVVQSQSKAGAKSPGTSAARKVQPKLKIVIRRLPPSLTEAEFLEIVGPLPSHDYFYFAEGSIKFGPFSFSRVYINFTSQADMVEFGQKFDNYVFVDQGGNEFPAVVEYAPCQRLPKSQPRPVAGGGYFMPGSGEVQMAPIPKSRADLSGTYESDPLFQEFLEKLNAEPGPVAILTPEDILAEIEAREKELKANHGLPNVITPLVAYVRQKNSEKERKRDEKRDERAKREQDKRKQKDEDRRKRREKKDAEAAEKRERQAAAKAAKLAKNLAFKKAKAEQLAKTKDKEKEKEKEETFPAIKLLKKPQTAEDEKKEKPGEKAEAKEKEPVAPKKEKEPVRSAVFVPSSKKAPYRQTKLEKEEKKKVMEDKRDEEERKKEADREEAAAAAREKRRNRDRPSIQIYRPPPRRGGGGQSESATTPEPPRESPHSPEPQKKLKTSGARNERREKRIARTSEGEWDEVKEEDGGGVKKGKGGQKSMTFSRSKHD